VSRDANDPRFQVVGPLGRGGTAEVFRALDREHNREVALKCPRADCETSPREFLTLARREYDLIGHLAFPGLVRLIDAPPEHNPCLAMELCSGPTLYDLNRIDDLTTGLNLISSLALALEFLYATGLIHGDLKPQNVFVPASWRETGRSPLTTVKLSDFSLGRRETEDENLRLGLGTMGYIAPETIREKRTSHRSDLFALGVIAYRLLSGVHPFMIENSEPVQVSSRIQEYTPPSVRDLRTDIPEAVAALIESLLAKDDSNRPSSAIEVCRGLQKAGAPLAVDRLLQPRHIVRNWDSIEGERPTLRLDDTARDRLARLTARNSARIRLVLGSNARRNMLHYRDRAFEPSGELIWPERLRREALGYFSHLRPADQKMLIRAAVIGTRAEAESLGINTTHLDQTFVPPLLPLLPSLVNTKTVRRLAARFAPRAEEIGNLRLATRLHLMAGVLEDADRCAEEAATILQGEHRMNEALRLLEQVISLARTTDQEFGARHLLRLKADILKTGGDLDKALATYIRITELYKDHAVDKALAVVYNRIGDVHRLRQETTLGLEALHKSLDVLTDLKAELEISHTLNNIGNALYVLSDVPGSMSSYRKALHIQRRLGVAAESASTLSNIASLYAVSGRLGRGIRLLKKSLEMKREVGDPGEIARTLNNLGYAYHLAGRPDRAADALSESLSINRRIGSKKEVLYNFENLSATMISAGRLREAIELFREGMDLARSLNSKAHLAAFHASTATVLKRMGEYSQAQQSLIKCRAILESIDDASLELVVSIQEAGLRYHSGDIEAAQRGIIDALEKAREKQNAESELDCLLLLVRISGDQAYLEQARTVINDLQLTREKLLVTFGRMEYLLEQGRSDEARAFAGDDLFAPLSLSGDIQVPWMANLAAEVLIEQGDLEQAASFVNRAELSAKESGLVPELGVTTMLRGRIFNLQGDTESAFANYRKALELFKRLAGNLDSDSERARFQGRRNIQFLAGEIRALSRLLAPKKEKGQVG